MSDARPLLEDRGHDPPRAYRPPDDRFGFELRIGGGDDEVHLVQGERAYHAWLQDRSFATELVDAACHSERLTEGEAGEARDFIENGYTWGAGERWLTLINGGDLLHDDRHPSLSRFYAAGTSDALARILGPEIPPDLTFELELVGVEDPDVDAAASRVLTYALGDRGLAGEILEAAKEPFLGWASPWELKLGARLTRMRARGFDLRLATHRLESESFCLRDGRLIYTDRWLVVLWGPPSGASWVEASGYSALPGRGRPYPSRSCVDGDDGSARCARLMQDIAWHNDWSGVTLAAEVDRWEHDFYAISAGGAKHQQETLRDLERRLGRLGMYVTDLEKAERTLRRRCTTLDALPCDAAGDILPACAALRDRIALTRADVRQGFSLLTAIGTSLQTAAGSRFQTGLGALTALVLVPGLVISLYGANVDGMPGLNDESGLRLMLALALIGAALTMVAIWAHGEWLRRVDEAHVPAQPKISDEPFALKEERMRGGSTAPEAARQSAEVTM